MEAKISKLWILDLEARLNRLALFYSEDQDRDEAGRWTDMGNNEGGKSETAETDSKITYDKITDEQAMLRYALKSNNVSMNTSIIVYEYGDLSVTYSVWPKDQTEAFKSSLDLALKESGEISSVHNYREGVGIYRRHAELFGLPTKDTSATFGKTKLNEILPDRYNAKAINKAYENIKNKQPIK